ncbi:hypothetical protein MTO96_051518 [Rhipicephalus appendiculatus]
MDFSDNQTRSTPTTTGTVGGDADSICRTHTTTNASEDDDEGWRTVPTLRQKKQQARERQQAPRNDPPNSSAEKSNFPRRSRKFRKLPPLTRDHFKVIIRPHQGLPMRILTSAMLADELIEACQKKVTGDRFLLRIKPGSNIAIVSAPRRRGG